MSEVQKLELTEKLDRWELTLNTGEVIIVWAHGVAEREGDYVFVALMCGMCRVAEMGWTHSINAPVHGPSGSLGTETVVTPAFWQTHIAGWVQC